MCAPPARKGQQMTGHDIVVIGASAGGVETLTKLVKDLPADMAAAVFVVLHIPAYGTSVLPDILQRKGPLPALHPKDGQAIEPGRIYVAPPDRHLVLYQGRLRLTRGPHENGVRPAVDTLFRSAARAYGPRVVGVVLSGMLDDGTAGAQAIKMRGGQVIVQDPDEAMFAGVPRHALEHVKADFVLPVAQIAPTLTRLTQTPVSETEMAPVPPEMETEVNQAMFKQDALESDHPGTPSAMACPECHGVLWEIEDDSLLRYRCRVGHAYSPASLLAEQSEVLEDALWVALRAFEENAALAERMKQRAQARGHLMSVRHFAEQVQEARQRAAIIRQALLRGEVAESISPDTVVTD